MAKKNKKAHKATTPSPTAAAQEQQQQQQQPTHTTPSPSSSPSPSSTLRAAVLFTNLPADMSAVYRHVLSRLTHTKDDSSNNNNNNNKSTKKEEEKTSSSSSRVTKSSTGNDKHTAQKSNSSSSNSGVDLSSLVMLEEADGAMLAVTVSSRAAAQHLFRQLQNRRVCGRRWKVQFVPHSATTCSKAACLVDCTTVPATTSALVERALAAVPGFLSLLVHTPSSASSSSAAAAASDAPGQTSALHGSGSRAMTSAVPAGGGHDASAHAVEYDRDGDDVDSDDVTALLPDGGEVVGHAVDDALHVDHNNNNKEDEGDCSAHFIASFVDEGSALHARAVLSGRLIGSSGVHMFLERRR